MWRGGWVDGITRDQSIVLIELWAWPFWIAIRYAIDKAYDNHPDWQAHRLAMITEIPTREQWQRDVDSAKNGGSFARDYYAKFR